MAGYKGRVFVLICAFILLGAVLCKKYEPNWPSIDSRPLPKWYDEAKVGIFIHWGVFSVPSYKSEWFWWYWKGSKNKDVVDYMKKNYKPDFTYQDFAPEFTAEFYDPEQWAEIFNASGARYVVLTSKHHEGFTNWPSKYSFSWNAMDVGPNRDLVGELAHAIRTKTPDIHFGLYHSLFEWFNPVYLNDKKNNFTTDDFVQFKTMPELYEIVNAYKPEVVWSDGDAGPDSYWNSTGFLAWLYNESPVKDTVVTNDRWGTGSACHHGGYYTCDDRYNPGKLQNHKWENCMTIDKYSWGFRREMDIADVLTMEELITTLAETVSCGGNILINVGPTKEGRIVPIFEERLRSLGQWLQVNGEAIYASTPWKFQNDTSTPGVWYTSKKADEGTVVYAIVLNWPQSQSLTLMSPNPQPQTFVTLIGYPTPVAWDYATQGHKGITLKLPVIPFNQMPCEYAWVFRMTYV